MTVTTADLTTASPKEIDAQLSAITERVYRQQRVVAELRVRLDRYRTTAYQDRGATAQLEARLVAAVAELAAVRAEADPLDAEFDRRGGWTRAFIVKNSNGHVHTSIHCYTCFSTTEFAWLYEVSGDDEAEIVTKAGESACTVCYPTAPTLPSFKTKGQFEEPDKKAARLEREAKAAAKAAKAAIEGITTPDGQPLYAIESSYRRATSNHVLIMGSLIRTETAARRQALSDLGSLAWYGEGHPMAAGWVANAAQCIEAVSAKTGQSVDSLRAEMDKKVAAKMRKNGR